ncbi:hypothetical protein CerSpe_241650 [Prunus speciosa]
MAARSPTSSLRPVTHPEVPPSENINLSMSQCIKIDELGSGSYGTVWRVMDPGDRLFAAKEVSLSDKRTKQLEQEIAVLSKFQHPNIVRYYGTDKDESKLYMFLEFVELGSLSKLYSKLSDSGSGLPDSEASKYTRQILQGLEYLHYKKVIHRDIKCANILVDTCGSVKLADFGLAKIIEGSSGHSILGSLPWMSPEVFKANKSAQGYGIAADIWSLGCTVLEMLTGTAPDHSCDAERALYSILPKIPVSLPTHPRDFIQRCLKVDPRGRPTATELLNHPFVQEEYARMTDPPTCATSQTATELLNHLFMQE